MRVVVVLIICLVLDGFCILGNLMWMCCLFCCCVIVFVMLSFLIWLCRVVKFCVIICLLNLFWFCLLKCSNIVVRLLVVDLVCIRFLNWFCNVEMSFVSCFLEFGKICSLIFFFILFVWILWILFLWSVNLVCWYILFKCFCIVLFKLILSINNILLFKLSFNLIGERLSCWSYCGFVVCLIILVFNCGYCVLIKFSVLVFWVGLFNKIVSCVWLLLVLVILKLCWFREVVIFCSVIVWFGKLMCN